MVDDWLSFGLSRCGSRTRDIIISLTCLKNPSRSLLLVTNKNPAAKNRRMLLQNIACLGCSRTCQLMWTEILFQQRKTFSIRLFWLPRFEQSVIHRKRILKSGNVCIFQFIEQCRKNIQIFYDLTE